MPAKQRCNIFTNVKCREIKAIKPWKNFMK